MQLLLHLDIVVFSICFLLSLRPILQARQEHLKLMQFKGKSLLNSDINLDEGSMESNDTKVLGDEISGYIVNVAREDGEEPITIPPSLSGSMKPHQVSFSLSNYYSSLILVVHF